MSVLEIVGTAAIVVAVLAGLALVRPGRSRGKASKADPYEEMLSAKYGLDAMAFQARRRLHDMRVSRKGATRS